MKELVLLFTSFFKIGIMTFGGGYAMLPMLERELVVNHKWATMEEIMDYFAIGQCTPGIIAVNTATFIGYKRKGILGGIIATLGVIAPSIIIISAIAGILDLVSENKYVKHAFAGISVAVCALLVQALIKMGKSGVKDIFTAILAVLSFAVSLAFGVSPIIPVVLSGIAGCVYMAIREKNKVSAKTQSEPDEKK